MPVMLLRNATELTQHVLWINLLLMAPLVVVKLVRCVHNLISAMAVGCVCRTTNLMVRYVGMLLSAVMRALAALVVVYLVVTRTRVLHVEILFLEIVMRKITVMDMVIALILWKTIPLSVGWLEKTVSVMPNVMGRARFVQVILSSWLVLLVEAAWKVNVLRRIRVV
jgi:hypothetical protein